MLKLYKKTIIICIWILVIAFLFSVGLEVYNVFVENTFGFIINYATGIACSSFVVVITTYLQYKAEKAKTVSEYSSSLRTLIFTLSLVYDVCVNNPNIAQLQTVFVKLDDAVSSTVRSGSELCYFSKKREQEFRNVHNEVFYLALQVEKYRFTSHEEVLQSIESRNRVREFLNSALIFLKSQDYYGVDHIAQTISKTEKDYLSGDSLRK